LSGATNPTFLANTAPVWVGLGAWVFFKEKQTLGFWGGLMVALTGATLILGVEALQSADLGRGSFYGLLAGVFYGVFFLFSQRGREYLDSLSFIWISSFTSGVVLLVFTILLKQPLFGYPTNTYLIFLAFGLVVQVLGWFAIAFAQGHLPASLVAPTLLGQPVMTAILAVPILGERITMWGALGGVAVLVGVYIVHRSRRD
jgi:drug/metabolite transporter (DMT)-like permease